MRICFITGAFPPDRCGIGDYTERLATNLAERGHAVSVITSCNPSARKHPRLNVFRIMKHWNVFEMNRIILTLRAIDAKVVHLQFPSVGFTSILSLALIPLLVRVLRYKSVVTLHEYCISPWKSRLRQFIMAAGAHEVITTNEEDRDHLAGLLSWKKKRIRLINIGSNIDPAPDIDLLRQTSRADIGAADGTPVFSYFGNLHPGKGVEELLDAFRIVHNQLPESKLLIIGSPEPSQTAFNTNLRARLTDANLLKSVHLTGYVSQPQVSQYLSASDICVLPYRDGLSTRRGSFLAAMRHRLPVVSTTPRFPLPSYMTDAESVLLVPPNNAERLAECLLLLWRSPGYRQKLSENIARLDRHFSWAEIARQNLEAYAYE